ncbi:xenotropic and polytropic murine leukemia virus receptor xpr1-like protein [Dinothrombium tinctorium]|uniref:Xenotropic and polytropic murine leukemia virus receptor xpr1-like protein n=1 Tax=Dinothrombium tinctorium TaxID=1965070 RepID=A0A443R4U5_9ACAR|nr:xenotropic and polytropic murine leukemia virus receptor xpr1-like protein [Dinothrombium tinctorium]RWS10307.1 xenotropic and polytropic murine leukemia virus receptor xpr1-like protein [Dinothrombium tinctorium]
MKFAEHLSAHITPEWRKQYILYEDMKTMLYNAVERMPSNEGSYAGNNEYLFKRFVHSFG